MTRDPTAIHESTRVIRLGSVVYDVVNVHFGKRPGIDVVPHTLTSQATWSVHDVRAIDLARHDVELISETELAAINAELRS